MALAPKVDPLDPALEFAAAATRVALAAAAHTVGLTIVEFEAWAEHHSHDGLPSSNEDAYYLIQSMKSYQGAGL